MQRRRAGAKGDGGGAYPAYQQKRRAQALERQQHARQDQLQQLRGLAQAAMEDAPNAETGSAMQEDVAASSSSGAAAARRPRQAVPEGARLFGADGVDPRCLSGAALRRYFARQLMTPEWLTDVPADLGSSWLVMPRPEGKRCLVISSGGVTFSRSRTGALQQRFSSRLPGGGPGQGGGPAWCVLDAIFQEEQVPACLGPGQQGQQQQQQLPGMPRQQQAQQRQAVRQGGDADEPMALDGAAAHQQQQQQHRPRPGGAAAAGGTYWIQDVLVWRGISMVDCGAECRLFWLASKLAEEATAAPPQQQQDAGAAGGGGSWALDGGDPGPGHDFRFRLLPSWRASPAGLSAAVCATQPGGACGCGSGSVAAGAAWFVQDGLYLRHAEGHYELSGAVSPLALLWKDASCSRYVLDTDAAGLVPQQQQVVLEFTGDADGSVATADEPPVVLGRLPAAFVSQMGSKLRPGRLLRFSLRGQGLLFSPDGSPAGADMAYEGPTNQRRGRADLISKVLFQWQARRGPVTLQALVTAAAGGGGDTAAAAQPAGAEPQPLEEG